MEGRRAGPGPPPNPGAAAGLAAPAQAALPRHPPRQPEFLCGSRELGRSIRTAQSPHSTLTFTRPYSDCVVTPSTSTTSTSSAGQLEAECGTYLQSVLLSRVSSLLLAALALPALTVLLSCRLQTSSRCGGRGPTGSLASPAPHSRLPPSYWPGGPGGRHSAAGRGNYIVVREGQGPRPLQPSLVPAGCAAPRPPCNPQPGGPAIAGAPPHNCSTRPPYCCERPELGGVPTGATSTGSSSNSYLPSAGRQIESETCPAPPVRLGSNNNGAGSRALPGVIIFPQRISENPAVS